MKRIIVLGCCGSGKSTFSKVLQEKLQLPLIHLDQHYWKPNWTETDPGIWKNKVTQLAEQDEWIIDGNYKGTIDIRLARADTVIYLDISTPKALFRILKRSWTYLGKTRPDMPRDCPERFTWEFFHYVATFNLTQRDHIFQKLDAQSEDKNIHILKSAESIQQFLNSS